MSENKEIITVNKEIILALGMVYSDIIFDKIEPFGQEWRDKIRLDALSLLGYTVYSMDDKHKPIQGKHCDANFNNPRRMRISINQQNVYQINLGARFIILDYFFSPVQPQNNNYFLYYMYKKL